MKRKLAGSLLVTTSVAGSFVAIGAVVGWGVALAAYGFLAAVTMFGFGWGLITDEPEHPWEEMNW